MTFFKSLYDVTKETLNIQTQAYLNSIVKIPKNGDVLFSAIAFFLAYNKKEENETLSYQREAMPVNCSNYLERLYNLFFDETVYKVFQYRESIQYLLEPVLGLMSKQHIRVFNAFLRYFYQYCDGSVLNLYYLIHFSDFESVKYPKLREESSKSMFLQLQEIRKFIEDSVEDTEPRLIKKKLEWHSLFPDPSIVDFLVSKYKQLGYFPFFAALNRTLLSKEEKSTSILRMCSKIYAEEEMKSLADVGKINDLTRERVRQIRSKQFRVLQSKIVKLSKTGCLEGFKYNAVKDYELKNIASREEVPFNSNFIVWVICQIDGQYKLIGNVNNVFFKFPTSTEILYAVHKTLCNHFNFTKFIESIELQLHEKRFYEERFELEQYVSHLCKKNTDTDTFYEIVKECRNILERGYPDIIVNSQLVFQQNARKPATKIIEDILRENDAPMTIDEIASVLGRDYPEMKQSSDKIRANALRNPNIIAISRTSTYTLREWAGVEGKRGGTIRELAAEYLNSLPQPIAQLSEICKYIAKFRTNVKEGNVKVNLLLEANDKYSLYFKDGLQFIGFTDWKFDDEYVKQDKRQKRLSFSDRIEQLEQFIKNNGRFPYSSSVPVEEVQLSRFYRLSLTYLKDGKLSQEDASEIERITTTYGHLKVKKERVSWDEWLERFVKHITENNTLPRRSSPEYAWYEENKALFDAGQLTPEQTSSFAFLNKIVNKMS